MGIGNETAEDGNGQPDPDKDKVIAGLQQAMDDRVGFMSRLGEPPRQVGGPDLKEETSDEPTFSRRWHLQNILTKPPLGAEGTMAQFHLKQK